MVPETKVISGAKFGCKMYSDHRVGVKFLHLPRADTPPALLPVAPRLPLREVGWAPRLLPGHPGLWSLHRERGAGGCVGEWGASWRAPGSSLETRPRFHRESMWGTELTLLLRMASSDIFRVRQMPGSQTALSREGHQRERRDPPSWPSQGSRPFRYSVLVCSEGRSFAADHMS